MSAIIDYDAFALTHDEEFLVRDWMAMQPEPKPSRGHAIKLLVESGLAARRVPTEFASGSVAGFVSSGTRMLAAGG